MVLDPRNGFNDDRTLTKQDIQQLEEVTHCIFVIIYEPGVVLPAALANFGKLTQNVFWHTFKHERHLMQDRATPPEYHD